MGGGIKVSAPKITMPKAVSNVGKAIEKSVSNVTKEAGKGIVDAGGVVKNVVKDTVAATATGVGNTVSQLGRTVGDKNIVNAGSNVSREGTSAANQYSGLLTDIAGNALTGGAYGAVSSLGSLAKNQKFDTGAIAGAVGSLAGYNPQLMQGLASAARGDIKGAALAGLGGLGSSGGQSLLSGLSGGQGGSNPFLSMLSNPNALKLGTSALTGDKSGLVSSLAGMSGFGDSASNLMGTAASGDMKKTALQALGSYGSQYGLSNNLQRTISGAVSGDPRNVAMGLLGSADVMDPNRLKALDALSGGKLTMDNAKAAFGGLIPSMGSDSVDSAASSGGFNFGDYTPDFLKGLSTSGMTPDMLKGLSTSGMLPFSTSGMLPNFSTDIAAGGKGSENTAAVKDFFGNMFGGGDNFQAGRAPAGTESMPEQTGAPSEGGFFDSVGNFIGDHATGLGLGADAISAGLAYNAGQKGFDYAKGLSKDQLKDLQASDQKFAQIAYDPQRYKQERQFIADRIAGGGITAQEKQMQQQGDLRAGRAGAGARAAALEQAARQTGATGSGSALATALAGGQSVMGIQSETNLAREATASQRMEQDIQRGTNISRQGTAEEADLARAQADTRLSALQQIGSTRGDLGNMEMNKRLAEQNLYLQGANMLKTGISTFSPSPQQPTQQPVRQPAQQPAPQQQPTQQPTQQPNTQPTQQPNTQPNTQPTTQPPKRTVAPPKPNVPTQSQVNSAINNNAYTIKKGDSLSKVYGQLGYKSWQEAYEANKDLVGKNPNLIKTGVTLRPKQSAAPQTATQQMNAKYSTSK